MRDKYLARHAEPEAALAGAIPGEWDHVIVVPVCGERAEALAGTVAASVGRRVLVIVVVNARAEHPEPVHAANAKLVAAHTEGARELAPGLWFRAGSPDLVLVDRASAGRRFGARDGVGLARKIGADLALGLGDRIRARWIHFTDADAALPGSYFEATRAAPEPARALVYPFSHEAGEDPRIADAHRRYELSLRYHVLGLRFARSPYAFHTIGSVLAVDRDAYAHVHGVPRRQAGEDFYLLNKLRKLGPVHAAAGEPIRIAARMSDRVPFGTGPAVRRLVDDPEGPGVYAPESFVALRAWLTTLDRAGRGEWDERGLDELRPPVRAALEQALDRMQARPALLALHERHRGASRLRQLHAWFDGFRTLKLIHALRDAGLGDRPWRDALAKAPFLAGLAATGAVEPLVAELAARELAP